ncbi:hypothetical protein J4455_04850 [Candidatus Woesearchaeota archaeon]|nr:hypothetical protein [Candidatus Woesearchaeota archaeon]
MKKYLFGLLLSIYFLTLSFANASGDIASDSLTINQGQTAILSDVDGSRISLNVISATENSAQIEIKQEDYKGNLISSKVNTITEGQITNDLLISDINSGLIEIKKPESTIDQAVLNSNQEIILPAEPTNPSCKPEKIASCLTLEEKTYRIIKIIDEKCNEVIYDAVLCEDRCNLGECNPTTNPTICEEKSLGFRCNNNLVEKGILLTNCKEEWNVHEKCEFECKDNNCVIPTTNVEPNQINKSYLFPKNQDIKCEGNFNQKSGTVQIWLKVTSDIMSGDLFYFLTDDSKNAIYLDSYGPQEVYSDTEGVGYRRIAARAGQRATETEASFMLVHPSYPLDSIDKWKAGEWHLISMTWQGDISGKVKLFIDGRKISENSYNDASMCSTFKFSQYEEGSIGDTYLYPYAKDEKEIAKDFLSSTLSSTPKLINYERVNNQVDNKNYKQYDFSLKPNDIKEFKDLTNKKYLFIKAKIDRFELAGAYPVMKLTYNDIVLTEKRLVNKKPEFHIKGTGKKTYNYFDSEINSFALHYSPDFYLNDNQHYNNNYVVAEGNSYVYVFDISDLARDNNKLIIENTGIYDFQLISGAVYDSQSVVEEVTQEQIIKEDVQIKEDKTFSLLDFGIEYKITKGNIIFRITNKFDEPIEIEDFFVNGISSILKSVTINNNEKSDIFVKNLMNYCYKDSTTNQMFISFKFKKGQAQYFVDGEGYRFTVDCPNTFTESTTESTPQEESGTDTPTESDEGFINLIKKILRMLGLANS